MKRPRHAALCGLRFVVNRKSRSHSFQGFLTMADPGLGNFPVRLGCARFGRRKRPFGGLLDLDEVASFALTASDNRRILERS